MNSHTFCRQELKLLNNFHPEVADIGILFGNDQVDVV
jgi:hypothetical protein